jgi:hypothetical protein
MSQAFVREGDEQSLSEIAPTLNSLIRFLTIENGGIRVYEKSANTAAAGNTLHTMSNGLTYGKDQNGRWEIKH